MMTNRNECYSITASRLVCHIGKTQILNDVNLQLTKGTMVAFVGPNGSGKSTLLRTLSGLLPYSEGSIKLAGQELKSLKGRDRAKIMTIVGQNETPPAGLNVSEVIALGLVPHRPPWAGGGRGERFAVKDALEKVGMTAYANRLFSHLSGGEQRRVLLARGLAQQTEILMLDEPTNHLDVKHQHALLEMVKQLDCSVVAAIHDLDMALTYFDHVGVIHDGTLQVFGPPTEVLTKELIRRCFEITATKVQLPEGRGDHLVLTYP